jgi:hypothetical protein
VISAFGKMLKKITEYNVKKPALFESAFKHDEFAGFNGMR